jgi:hypothetical protein
MTKLRRPAALSLLLLLMPTLLTSCSGGTRWKPYAPVQVRSAGQASLVYLRMKARLEQLGYQLQQADPARRYLRVMARLDEAFVGRPQWSVSQASYFNVQIQGDGSAEITVTGRHIKREPSGELIHYQLEDELHRLAADLEAAAKSPVRKP